MYSVIGHFVKSNRKKLNLSIDALSMMSGVSASTISAIEYGQRNCSFWTLYYLVKSLELSLSDLEKFIDNEA